MLDEGGKPIGSIASSTYRLIKKIEKPWFTFCKKFPEWCSVDEWPPVLTYKEENGVRKIWWNKIIHFIQHCDELPKVTPTFIKDAILFAQTYCKREGRLCGEYDLCPDGTIGKQAAIAAVKEKHYRSKATKDIREGKDVQALIDPQITTKQMIEMAHQAFDPSDDNLKSIPLLSRLQTYTQMRDTHMTAVRGANCREATLGMQFVRNLLNNGEVDDLYVYSAGKTNQYGHKEYNGTVPHVNPLLDFAAMLGLCFLTRFSLMMEKFPSHIDGKEILNRPVYRAAQCATNYISKTSQYNMFVTFYESCKIWVHKVTHMGRFCCFNELIQKGIPTETVARHTHSGESRGMDVTRSMMKCYLTSPCLDAMVQRAGGDHRYPELHRPSWAHVVVPDALVEFVAPYLYLEKKRIMRKKEECADFFDLADNRMFMAEGSIKSFENKIKRALLFASARPFDENGKLNVDSPPLYM